MGFACYEEQKTVKTTNKEEVYEAELILWCFCLEYEVQAKKKGKKGMKPVWNNEEIFKISKRKIIVIFKINK